MAGRIALLERSANASRGTGGDPRSLCADDLWTVEAVREDAVVRLHLERADVGAPAGDTHVAGAALVERIVEVIVAGIDRGTRRGERMRARRAAVVGKGLQARIAVQRIGRERDVGIRLVDQIVRAV